MVEIIDRAERFCSNIEAKILDVAPLDAQEQLELRGKLGLCRSEIAHLRSLKRITINNPDVREGLRHLVTAMMWVAFYARTAIDFRLYRMLLTVEATFTYLLIQQIPKSPQNGQG